jgi:hypothetical protein
MRNMFVKMMNAFVNMTNVRYSSGGWGWWIYIYLSNVGQCGPGEYVIINSLLAFHMQHESGTGINHWYEVLDVLWGNWYTWLYIYAIHVHLWMISHNVTSRVYEYLTMELHCMINFCTELKYRRIQHGFPFVHSGPYGQLVYRPFLNSCHLLSS